MDTTQIIGILAAVFTTIANIPQAYIIIREKSAREVSATTYGILFLGTSFWVAYGILKEDWPIIVTNSISTLTSMIILFLNFTSQKIINKIHKSVIPEKIKEEAKKSLKGKKR
jgi:MtN3 and saliva related transmembrane protein